MLYTLDNNEKEFKQVKNIFVRIKFLKEILNNSDMYYQYELRDSDTPEVVAHKLYGDANRYWIVLLANEIIDPYYGVPLKYQSFDNFIISKYGSLEDAQTELHHYEKRVTVTTNKQGLINTQVYKTELTDGYYDETTQSIVYVSDIGYLPNVANPTVDVSNTSTTIEDYDGINVAISTSTQYTFVSNYDYEVSANEDKRIINLFKPEYVSFIEEEFEQLLKK